MDRAKILDKLQVEVIILGLMINKLEDSLKMKEEIGFGESIGFGVCGVDDYEGI